MVAVREGIDAYLEHVIVERGLSVNTVAAYRRDLDRFVEWLDGVGIDDLAAVSASQLGDFVTWASRDAGLSASSVRHTPPPAANIQRRQRPWPEPRAAWCPSP